MNSPTLICQNEKRRHRVRESDELNGLDFLEVGADQRTLTVFLLQKASDDLRQRFAAPNAVAHIRIEGGRRTRDVRAETAELRHLNDPRKDDYLVIVLNHSGDFSRYTLRLADLDSPSNPMPGIDPRYARLEFGFKEGCPTDLDCKTSKACPPPERPQPEINYLAKDYASFRQLLLDRLSQIMPAWKERHVPDLGVTLVEILAYAGDYLSYYQDAVATEAYLDTARQRISVRRHVRLVDYHMHEGCNSRTWVTVSTETEESLDPNNVYFITRFDQTTPSGAVLLDAELDDVPLSRYKVFEPVVDDPASHLTLFPGHNEIHFYTWGDDECCLPKGATSATLFDSDGAIEPRLHLQPGDVLIFEEIVGPKTGNAADADKTHRHAVRLTKVEQSIDPLNNYRLVEIEWAEEDALPFPLCISAIGPAPGCELLQNLSVAHGNVILVDHGRRLSDNLGQVRLKAQTLACACEGRPEETILEPESFRPRLQNGPLTFSQLLAAGTPASQSLQQDPAQALPRILLSCSCIVPGGVVNTPWFVRRDLLHSEREDYHFVVEMDNDGIAHPRFGEGESGRRPEAGENFTAGYRVGNGAAGNIGAETIAHLVFRNAKLSGLTPRNPLPATGGIDPQPLAEVKLFAPTAFRKRLKRAITPEDYAELAASHPRVQRAASTLRWNGSWHEMLVAIDPFGKVETEQSLLDEVALYLQRFRRMGHNLVVRRAQFVPLDLVLEICVLPGFLRGHVKAELLRLFSNRISPEGARGFFHPDNYTFGQAVRLSSLIAKAQAVPGVEGVDITKFERLFEGPNHELENGLLPLNPLEIARLDNDPSVPENGRLEIIVRGGR